MHIRTTLFLAFLWAALFGSGATAIAQDRNNDPVLCGSVDLVILIDTTFSLATAIGEMKREAQTIIDLLETVSVGEYRLGLIAFDDSVRVLEDLNDDPDPASKAEQVRKAIRGLRARGGDGGPEASDEALNTAINGLGPEGRSQSGAFTGDWRGHSRIIVLITDNKPGGFDDHFVPGVDDRRALDYASQALNKDIRISAIIVPTSGLDDTPDEEAASIMRGYAATTGGLYVETRWAGFGTAEAILSILKACGSNLLS